MADPADLLHERFAAAIEAVLGPDHAGADPVVRPSGNPELGDHQVNAAMALAKKVGRSPRDLAAALVAAVDLVGIAATVDVAGPGFINVRLEDSFLSASVSALGGDARLGIAPAAKREVVVVDYSHPNVAKEMHVGHLRSTIIGDAIVRLHEFLGHRVIRQNHIGDWGTPFGMLIEHLLDLGEDVAAAEQSLGDLTGFYQQARVKFDDQEGFADRARARVVALQVGDPETRRLWHLLVDESTRYFNLVYDRLSVLLTDDDLAGESMYNDLLAPVAADLEERGLAVISEGALCLFPPGFTGRDGAPLPLIVRKSDGGYGYATTDLAAAKYRTGTLGATLILYIVGSPQSQHLAMVTTGAQMAGWYDEAHRAIHAPFGSVLGKDGKTLKTRSGETPKLIDLLDEAVVRAAAIVEERSGHLPAEERGAIAEAVGIGGVKYADLSSDRVKDYVFDYDRMLATDGNTAAYLQYAAARARSILRKASDELGEVPAPQAALTQPAERTLALALLRLGGAVHAATTDLAPHKLCTHLFELAQAFTSFYESCPVMKADDAAVRGSRLAMCALVAGALTLGLGLLGIDTPTRM